MRLWEMFSNTTEGIKWNDPSSEIPPPPKKHKKKKEYDPKEGDYATVYPHPNDPFLIVKKENYFTDPETNGYNQWVRTIARKTAKNPYLPRIYIAKSEVSPDGVKKRYIYVIEKLFHPQSIAGRLGKIDEKVLKSIGNKLIKNFNSIIKWHHEEMKKSASPNLRAKIVHRGVTKKEVWTLITQIINEALESGDFSQLKDYYLIEACKLVLGARHWLSQSGSKEDIDVHSHNVMTRFTSTGPQIVITDPLG